jgi:hypothetical protein
MMTIAQRSMLWMAIAAVMGVMGVAAASSYAAVPKSPRIQSTLVVPVDFESCAAKCRKVTGSSCLEKCQKEKKK